MKLVSFRPSPRKCGVYLGHAYAQSTRGRRYMFAVCLDGKRAKPHAVFREEPINREMAGNWWRQIGPPIALRHEVAKAARTGALLNLPW